MSDIDFLANNKADDDQEPKNKGGKKEEIIWSEPEDNKPIPKQSAFYALSNLRKKLAAKEPTAPKPAVDRISRDKINASRQEILKLIKKNESPALREEKKINKNFLAGLLEKMKKQPSHKEIFINYEQAFSQEKSKRGQAGGSAGPTDFKQIKPVANNQPADEKKAPKPKLAPQDGFFSRFFKLLKDKLSAISLAKAKPVKINLTEAINDANRPPALPPRPKPAASEKKEVKTKEEAARLTTPDLTGGKSQKVLETNLIKGEIITFFDWHKKIINLISAIIIPVVFIGLIYLGLGYYQKYNRGKIQDQEKKIVLLNEKIDQQELSLAEINQFQARLKTVSQIFSEHIYWTNFFKFLEDNTIEDVYYNGFAGNTSGNYSLKAIALKYSNISQQVNVFKNSQRVIDVNTAGGEATPDKADNKIKVNFDLNFTVQKSIFIE